MAYGTPILVKGNLTDNVKLQFAQNSGKAFVKFSVAVNKKSEIKGEMVEKVSFFNCTVFGQQAENLAASAVKGTRVTVDGYMEQDNWVDPKTDAKRSTYVVIADEVSVSLRWATAVVERNASNGGARTSAPAADAEQGSDNIFMGDENAPF